MISCEYCGTIFNTQSSLNTHKNKAKYCLVIQGKIKNNITEFKCNFCKKLLSSKQYLEIHTQKCESNQPYNTLETENKFKCNFCNKVLSTKKNLNSHNLVCLDQKNKTIEKMYKDNKEKDKLIMELKMQNNLYEKQFKDLLLKQEEQIKDLQNKLDKIANKAIDRPTITNNTINNKFELNTFPSQSEIDQKIESQFNDKYLLDGIKGVAQFVYDHIVKLEDGSIAYACFDTSRQVFKYKDQNGNEIKDPKAVKLRRMIKPGLLRQSQTLFDYFNEECDYLEKEKQAD